MSQYDDAKASIGELLITGLEGTELHDETSAFLTQAQIGGVLLFAHNYKDPVQVAKLITQIQEAAKSLPLWISVDHEGGRVQRFKKPFTLIPTAEILSKTTSTKNLFDLAFAIATELKAVGINLNFNPVADIMTNPQNPVIGDRAYGFDEENVSKMITAVVRGHLQGGVAPCVKHFPGHGDTHVDSHFALPEVTTTLDVLREREFKPFSKAFKSHCGFVMTAHIINKNLDPKYPATLSEFTLKEILRKELRYNRLIISDDLEMQAITDHYGAQEAPVIALNAGCDLLIYRTEKAARHAYEALINALDEGTLSPQTILTASERSKAYKKEILMPYKKPDLNRLDVIGCQNHQAILKKLLS